MPGKAAQIVQAKSESTDSQKSSKSVSNKNSSVKKIIGENRRLSACFNGRAGTRKKQSRHSASRQRFGFGESPVRRRKDFRQNLVA
jgi:hypothetical protein